MATHPPIEERMRRINPHVSPDFYFRKAKVPRAEEKSAVVKAPEQEKPTTIVPRRLMEHELLRAVACVLDCPMPPTIAALDPRLLRK